MLATNAVLSINRRTEAVFAGKSIRASSIYGFIFPTVPTTIEFNSSVSNSSSIEGKSCCTLRNTERYHTTEHIISCVDERSRANVNLSWPIAAGPNPERPRSIAARQRPPDEVSPSKQAGFIVRARSRGGSGSQELDRQRQRKDSRGWTPRNTGREARSARGARGSQRPGSRGVGADEKVAT